MSDFWTIQVAGQTYGPYPLDHMKAFIAEGRVVAKSLVRYGRDTQFHHASDDLVLGPFLAAPQTAAQHYAPEPLDTHRPDPALQSFGRIEAAEPSHMVVMVDLKSASPMRIEAVIHSLGFAYPLLPNIWLLSTNETVNAVRNILVQKLGKQDVLFVVDASHDKAAWFNLSPEPEARIRRLWGKDPLRKSG